MIKEAMERLLSISGPVIEEDRFHRYEYYNGSRTVTDIPPPELLRTIDTLESFIDCVNSGIVDAVSVYEKFAKAYSDHFDLRKTVWRMPLVPSNEYRCLAKLAQDKKWMTQVEVLELLEDDLRNIDLDDLRTKLAILRSTKSHGRDIGPMHDKGVAEFTTEAAENIPTELFATVAPLQGIPCSTSVEIRLKIDPGNLTIRLHPFCGELQKLREYGVNWLKTHLSDNLEVPVYRGDISIPM